jgi:UrcA family protein
MKTLLVFAALLAASTTAPALAEGTGSAQQISIRYGDLDLSSSAGVRALDRRIFNAASAYCGTASSADPRGREKVEDCRADIRASVDTQRKEVIALARQSQPTSLASAR